MVTLQEQGVFTPFEMLTDALKSREAQRVAREEVAAKQRIAAMQARADMAKARLSAQISRETIAADQQKASAQDRLRQALGEAAAVPTPLSPLEQAQQSMQMDVANEYRSLVNKGMSPSEAMKSLGMGLGPTGFKTTAQQEPTEFDLQREQRMRDQFEAAARARDEANRLAGVRAETGQEAQRAKTDVGLQGRLAMEKEVSKQQGKSMQAVAANKREMAETYSKMLPTLTETYEMVASGKAAQGLFSGLETTISKAAVDMATALGIDMSRDGWRANLAEKIRTTEGLNTMLGAEVFPQIKALGIGARGIDTPAERDFLATVIAGTTKMEPGSLKQLLARRMRMAYNTISDYNSNIEEGYGDIGEMAKKYPNSYRPVKIKTHLTDFGDDSDRHLGYLYQVMNQQLPGAAPGGGAGGNIGPIGPPLDPSRIRR